ncbi:MAG TPA: hypothetical protein PLZ16_16085, partial [Gammaproteobacteria bacterium]|nr:hypothetical protein [Gammaproteobacteria bacterium]
MTGSVNSGEIRQGRLLALMTAVICCLFVFSLFIGSNPIPVVTAALDVAGDVRSVIALILTEVRLPRALIALLAGAT